MSVPFASSSSPGTQQDLSAAIAALQTYLRPYADIPDDAVTYADPSHALRLRHLRAIAAALAAPHVPGQRVVSYEEFAAVMEADDDDEPASAHLYVWDPRGYNVGSGTHHYFLAVQS